MRVGIRKDHLVDSTCEPDSLPFEPAQTDLTFDRKELPQQFHKLTFPGWFYITNCNCPDQIRIPRASRVSYQASPSLQSVACGLFLLSITPKCKCQSESNGPAVEIQPSACHLPSKHRDSRRRRVLDEITL